MSKEFNFFKGRGGIDYDKSERPPMQTLFVCNDVPNWVIKMFEEACFKIKMHVLPDIALRFMSSKFLEFCEDQLFLKDPKMILQGREVRTSLNAYIVDVLNKVDYKKILEKNGDQLLDLYLKRFLSKYILHNED
jgi:hypothetical protein